MCECVCVCACARLRACVREGVLLNLDGVCAPVAATEGEGGGCDRPGEDDKSGSEGKEERK